jgi:RNA polymerase sigma-70 factor (ECF subfamily)
VQQHNYSRIIKTIANTAEEQQLQEQRLSLIEQAIEQLPPQQKKVYLLSRMDKLTYAEIAGQLNISRETVKTHIQVAVAAITKFMRSHPEAGLWGAFWLFITEK